MAIHTKDLPDVAAERAKQRAQEEIRKKKDTTRKKVQAHKKKKWNQLNNNQKDDILKVLAVDAGLVQPDDD
jgi:F0F1-type ATP synthase epsilon subunit